VPPDTILCCPAQGETDFCIWLCPTVPLGANQYVGEMLAKGVCYPPMETTCRCLLGGEQSALLLTGEGTRKLDV